MKYGVTILKRQSQRNINRKQKAIQNDLADSKKNEIELSKWKATITEIKKVIKWV